MWFPRFATIVVAVAVAATEVDLDARNLECKLRGRKRRRDGGVLTLSASSNWNLNGRRASELLRNVLRVQVQVAANAVGVVVVGEPPGGRVSRATCSWQQATATNRNKQVQTWSARAK